MSTSAEPRPYSVVRLLGRGGMAQVFEAVATGAGGFRRRVALKRILPDHHADASVLRSFVDEAKLASHLHHGGIVGVLDYGLLEGVPFMVLELVDGRDARSLAESGRAKGEPLSPALALHVGREVAHALHYAHEATGEDGRKLGLVHRDIKPANILISWSGDVKISDFGIAFASVRTEQTVDGMTKGTPAYMSPEQTMGGEVDARSDVFSLGCTLHALLTGKSPLSLQGAVMRVLAGNDPQLDAELPGDVREILARATRADREARFASAAELADALGRAAARRLDDDPKTRLIAWLAAVRGEAAPAPEVGALDALLGAELVLDGGTREATVRHAGVGLAAAAREATVRHADVGLAAGARDASALYADHGRNEGESERGTARVEERAGALRASEPRGSEALPALRAEETVRLQAAAPGGSAAIESAAKGSAELVSAEVVGAAVGSAQTPRKRGRSGMMVLVGIGALGASAIVASRFLRADPMALPAASAGVFGAESAPGVVASAAAAAGSTGAAAPSGGASAVASGAPNGLVSVGARAALPRAGASGAPVSSVAASGSSTPGSALVSASALPSAAPGSGGAGASGASPTGSISAVDPGVLGTLAVGGPVGASVLVDGASRGLTPKYIQLALGSHRVEVVDSSGARLGSTVVLLKPEHTASAPLRWSPAASKP